MALCSFFHSIFFLVFSSNELFDPRIEEFVWFETISEDSPQPQPSYCCSGLENLKEEHQPNTILNKAKKNEYHFVLKKTAVRFSVFSFPKVSKTFTRGGGTNMVPLFFYYLIPRCSKQNSGSLLLGSHGCYVFLLFSLYLSSFSINFSNVSICSVMFPLNIF